MRSQTADLDRVVRCQGSEVPKPYYPMENGFRERPLSN